MDNRWDGYEPEEYATYYGSAGRKSLQAVGVFGMQQRINCVHFVIDRYPEVSIKNAGRQHRAASGSQKIHISKPDQPIPKLWKKYLAHGYNKKSLVNFFFETWKKADVAALKGVTVFFIHGEHCHSITPLSGSVIVQEIAQFFCFSKCLQKVWADNSGTLVPLGI